MDSTAASTAPPLPDARAGTPAQAPGEPSVPPTAASASPPPLGSLGEVQMVSDLKGELFHLSRQLTLARQQTQSSEETCAELRQRCQELEVDRQTLSVQLQEATDRLQARQARMEEHRREAATASLTVVALTAERDEMAAQLQQAWDRVAELSAALRSEAADRTRLQAEAAEARHARELVAQQCSTAERQLRALETRLHGQEGVAHSQAHAKERLTAVLQGAVQRLAGLLSDVACRYQESVADDELRSGQQAPHGVHSLYTARKEETRRHVDSLATPHVVISPAQPSAQVDAFSPSADSVSRHRAEQLLYNAESVLLDSWWGGVAPPLSPQTTASSTLARGKKGEEEADGEAAAAHGEAQGSAHSSPRSHTASTPPSRTLAVRPSASVADGALASVVAAPAESAEAVAVRAALSPLLLALKHLSAMLGNVRHEHMRTAAAAHHFQSRYEEAQHQLEAAQRELQGQESTSGSAREQMRLLVQRAELAERAVLQRGAEDDQRRVVLARLLSCGEDWALIQHSVERLLGQRAELRRDVAHLRSLHGLPARDDSMTVPSGSALVNGNDDANRAQQHRDTQRHAVSTPVRHRDSSEPIGFQKDSSAYESGRGGSPLQVHKAHSGAAFSLEQEEEFSASKGDSRGASVVSGSTGHAPALPSRGAYADALSAVLSGRPAEGDLTAGGQAADPLPHQQSHRQSNLTGAPQPHLSPPPAHVTIAGAAVAPSPSVNLNPSVSRRYPPPMPPSAVAVEAAAPSPATQPPPAVPSVAERELLHSLYGDSRLRSPPVPPPLPGRPAGPLADPSTLFAAEVLQVIEALDRRVSGALSRAPRP